MQTQTETETAPPEGSTVLPLFASRLPALATAGDIARRLDAPAYIVSYAARDVEAATVQPGRVKLYDRAGQERVARKLKAVHLDSNPDFAKKAGDLAAAAGSDVVTDEICRIALEARAGAEAEAEGLRKDRIREALDTYDKAGLIDPDIMEILLMSPQERKAHRAENRKLLRGYRGLLADYQAEIERIESKYRRTEPNGVEITRNHRPERGDE